MSQLDYDFSQCVQLFQKHLERNNYSPETIRGYEQDLMYFGEFIMEKKEKDSIGIREIGKRDLLNFMDDGREKGHKVNSVARRISTMKSFYKFLVYELDYDIDVAARVRMPRAYVPLPQILSEAEVKRLLNKSRELSPLYELLFSIIYYTGSRLSPVRLLQVDHVYTKERMIYFPKVKGGKDLYLPLHERVINLFDNYMTTYFTSQSSYVFPSKRIPNQPVSPADIRKKLRKAATLAKIDKHITPHTLRHCTATHLTINKVDQRTIASILGHADLRSTMRYQHLSVDHLRDPINAL